MQKANLYTGTYNLVVISGLWNSNTDAFINNATVRITLKDDAGVNVTGETWPVTGSYVSGSDGRYHIILDTDAAITAGEVYTGVLEILVSAVVVATIRLELPAQEHWR